MRKGFIRGPGITAREFTGSDPAFRGRIAVERGSGFLEFPNLSQLYRIACEESVPKAAVDAAFGHMSRGLKKNAAEEKKYPAPGLKLGHFDESGVLRPGVRHGQLMLFEQRGPERKLLWGVVELVDDKTRLRNIITNRTIPIESAGDQAVKLGIPPAAFKEAFHRLFVFRRTRRGRRGQRGRSAAE